jgi:hypothetical protein
MSLAGDDGQVMHCYHPKRALVDEVKVEADAAPREPTTLAELGREQLPAVDVCIGRMLDMAETAFPKNYKVRCHRIGAVRPSRVQYNECVCEQHGGAAGSAMVKDSRELRRGCRARGCGGSTLHSASHKQRSAPLITVRSLAI